MCGGFKCDSAELGSRLCGQQQRHARVSRHLQTALPPTLPTAVPTLATSNPQPYVDIKLMQGRPRGTHAMAHSNHKQGTQKVFRFLN